MSIEEIDENALVENEILQLKRELKDLHTKSDDLQIICENLIDFVTNTFDPLCIEGDTKTVFEGYTKNWKVPKKPVPPTGKWLTFPDKWQVPMYPHLWEICFLFLDYGSFLTVKNVCKSFYDISQGVASAFQTRMLHYSAQMQHNRRKKNFENLCREHPSGWQSKKLNIASIFKDKFQLSRSEKHKYEDILVIGPNGSGKTSFLYKWFVSDSGAELLRTHVVEMMKLLVKLPKLEKLHLKVTSPESVVEIWKKEVVKQAYYDEISKPMTEEFSLAFLGHNLDYFFDKAGDYAKLDYLLNTTDRKKIFEDMFIGTTSFVYLHMEAYKKKYRLAQLTEDNSRKMELFFPRLAKVIVCIAFDELDKVEFYLQRTQHFLVRCVVITKLDVLRKMISENTINSIPYWSDYKDGTGITDLRNYVVSKLPIWADLYAFIDNHDEAVFEDTASVYYLFFPE